MSAINPVSPISAAEPPKANPLSKIASQATTPPLKPVLRPSVDDAKGKTAQVDAIEALKNVTQNLKSVTAPIPQQAILHKTGILSDPGLSEAQIQAAKSKTARISLSDAIGADPVKNDASPMRTIRIKRPSDIAGATDANLEDAKTIAPAPADEPTATQRKTLKISRPTGGVVRPTGKFTVKRPTTTATPAPASAEKAAENGGDVADIPDIADIPETSTAKPLVPVAVPAPTVSKGMTTASLIFQVAACGVIGALVWFLFQDFSLELFRGGCQALMP